MSTMTVVSIVGLAAAVVGIWVAIHYGRKRRRPRLVYRCTGELLVDESGGALPKEVSIRYDGEEVSRLSMTQLVVWNAGQSPIRAQDLIQDDRLRFEFEPSTRILQAEAVRVTRPVNDVRLSVDDANRHTLELDFHFLDENDGATIRVLHTGLEAEPQAEGTIIGQPNGIEYWGNVYGGSREARSGRGKWRSDDHVSAAVGRLFQLFRNALLAVAALTMVGFYIVRSTVFGQVHLTFGQGPAATLAIPGHTLLIIVLAVIGSYLIFVLALALRVILGLMLPEQRGFPQALRTDD